MVIVSTGTQFDRSRVKNARRFVEVNLGNFVPGTGPLDESYKNSLIMFLRLR
ncbi:hypothetical protein FHS20_002543 [Phyllobacterium endophyticum]|jgi:hypothetical protein|nr:hypothetical protein [Phyllobacterium endophyticum]